MKRSWSWLSVCCAPTQRPHTDPILPTHCPHPHPRQLQGVWPGNRVVAQLQALRHALVTLAGVAQALNVLRQGKLGDLGVGGGKGIELRIS